MREIWNEAHFSGKCLLIFQRQMLQQSFQIVTKAIAAECILGHWINIPKNMGNDPNVLFCNMTSSSFYKLPSKFANIFIDNESLTVLICVIWNFSLWNLSFSDTFALALVSSYFYIHDLDEDLAQPSIQHLSAPYFARVSALFYHTSQ